MAYESRKKKISTFAVDDALTDSSTLDFIKDGINKKTSWANIRNKLSEVFGLGARLFATEAELIASDIAIGDYAIVEENNTALYKITSLAANSYDVTLTSGFTASLDGPLLLEPVADYTALRAINTNGIKAGQTLTVTNSGIAGSGVLRNVVGHGLTDNGRTIIVISADWYWERSVGPHYHAFVGLSQIGSLDLTDVETVVFPYQTTPGDGKVELRRDNSSTLPASSYPVETDSAGNIFVRQPYQVNILTGIKLNPQDKGVVYGIGLTQAQQEDNSGYLQEALDNAGELRVTGNIEIYDSVMISSNMVIEGMSRAICSIRGKHPTDPTIIDATLTAPNAQENNTRDVVISRLKIESANSHCIHVTPYQWRIVDSRFTCLNGSAIKHHTGGYQVENHYERNYFTSCGRAIDAAAVGFRQATDQHIIDNEFFGAGATDHVINLYTPSGSLLSGNHYYGGATREFVRLVGGINVRLNNEYYESMANARLAIIGGNPTSYSVSGCSFWGGDGSGVDWNGNQQHLISVQFSEFNSNSYGFSGNAFESGSNSVPVFGLLNGTYDALGGCKIGFDSSNVMNGVYAKGVRLGTNNSVNVVQSNHADFYNYDTVTSNPIFGRGEYSEFLYGYEAAGSVGHTLPSSPRWAAKKPLVIRNVSTTTTVTFSAGATTVNGSTSLAPGESIRIIQDPSDATAYRIFKI